MLDERSKANEEARGLPGDWPAVNWKPPGSRAKQPLLLRIRSATAARCAASSAYVGACRTEPLSLAHMRDVLRGGGCGSPALRAIGIVCSCCGAHKEHVLANRSVIGLAALLSAQDLSGDAPVPSQNVHECAASIAEQLAAAHEPSVAALKSASPEVSVQSVVSAVVPVFVTVHVPSVAAFKSPSPEASVQSVVSVVVTVASEYTPLT